MIRRPLVSLPVLGLLCALLALSLSGCGRASGSTKAAGSAPATNAAGGKSPSTGGSSTALNLPQVARADVLEPPADYSAYQALPSFTYHHVDPKLKNNIAITPATFESQLKILADLGYHTVTARQVIEHQTKGTALPDKPVMITFDDGWRNQYTYAFPLLKKYGMVATFFINPQPISAGYKGYLSRDMVEQMDATGMDIESHTWRHLRMTRDRSQTAEQFQKRYIGELTKANAWIKTVTGKAPVALCYPFGYYDVETIGMAQAVGLKGGYTVDEGVADARPWDAWGMKRFTISNVETAASFKRRLLSGPLQVTNIQPAPANRIIGTTTTVTVDISAVSADIQNIRMSGGPSLRKFTITESNGKKFATAVIKGGKTGFRAMAMRGQGPDGRVYYASWGLVTGDKPH